MDRKKARDGTLSEGKELSQRNVSTEKSGKGRSVLTTEEERRIEYSRHEKILGKKTGITEDKPKSHTASN